MYNQCSKSASKFTSQRILNIKRLLWCLMKLDSCIVSIHFLRITFPVFHCILYTPASIPGIFSCNTLLLIYLFLYLKRTETYFQSWKFTSCLEKTPHTSMCHNIRTDQHWCKAQIIWSLIRISHFSFRKLSISWRF